MTRPLLALALLPALLLPAFLLTACSAPAATPTADPEPVVLEVPAIDGEWVMTRTVNADTTGEYAIGTVETRYLVIDASECDETTCTGALSSSASEDIFTSVEMNASTADYVWDGTSFTYAFDPSPLDCSTDTGEVLVAGLYTNTVEYDLEAVIDGDSVESLTGTATQGFEVAGDPGDSGCPGAGAVDYDVQFARR